MDRDKHSIFSPERAAYLDQLWQDAQNPPSDSELIDRNLEESRRMLDEIHKSPIFRDLYKDSKEE